jgi:hypothetical protein
MKLVVYTPLDEDGTSEKLRELLGRGGIANSRAS